MSVKGALLQDIGSLEVSLFLYVSVHVVTNHGSERQTLHIFSVYYVTWHGLIFLDPALFCIAVHE